MQHTLQLKQNIQMIKEQKQAISQKKQLDKREMARKMAEEQLFREVTTKYQKL